MLCAVQVQELWKWDIHYYEWTFVNDSTTRPSAREQHTAVVVDGNLYIFGGRSTIYPSGTRVVYADLWKLTVPHSHVYQFNYAAPGNGLQLLDHGIMYAAINGSDPTPNANRDSDRSGLCVSSVTVRVSIASDCSPC